MVWSFRYEPRGPRPDGRIVEGHRGLLEVVDATPDGGVGLIGGWQGTSGRPIKPETVPKVIQFFRKRPLLDYEALFVWTVSDRLRALIEEMEPGAHQFERVEALAKNGSPLETRWFWQICNRLDSVHSEETLWDFDGHSWRIPPRWDKKSHLIFDLSKIGKTKFWHDKHVVSASFCSNEAHDRLVAEGMTGFRYSYREQA